MAFLILPLPITALVIPQLLFTATFLIPECSENPDGRLDQEAEDELREPTTERHVDSQTHHCAKVEAEFTSKQQIHGPTVGALNAESPKRPF